MNIKLPIVSCDFKVSGIYLNDIDEKIEKMIRFAFKNGDLEKYDGKTNKEILEDGETVFEAHGVYFNKVEFKPVIIEEKEEIEVYVENISNDEMIMVGYVPKSKIKSVKKYLELKEIYPNYKYICDAFLTGGKAKKVVVDFEEAELEEIELSYGINISIAIYEPTE